MEINHFSHGHPLILSEEKHNTKFPCRICGEPIFGLSYCCQICPYVLHKWCSDLPHELSSHQDHSSDHPLILTPRTPSGSSTCQICKRCTEEIKFPGSAYTCIAKECCSLSLHVECASFLESIDFEFPNINHETASTIYFRRDYLRIETVYEDDRNCEICGYDCSGPRFFTFEIHTRYLHVHCAMLPRKVKHKRHLHELTLHPPLDEKEKYFEFFCDACEQERDPDDHVYYCDPSCEYVAHIGCGITGTERPIQDILGTCSVYEIVEQEEEEEEEEEEEVEVVDEDKDILYSGHEHPLILFNYQRPTDKNCHGCFSTLFGKTYSCKICDLHLHKWCTQLPEGVQHWMHPVHPMFPNHGPLKLNPCTRKLFQDISLGLVYSKCPICSAYVITPSKSGVFYKCEKCDFLMHGLCAMLPHKLNHRSHEHPLRIYKQEKEGESSRKPLCQACKFPCDEIVSLSCKSCDFYLHMQCFLLPYAGKHTTHMHNLNLTYSYKEDPRALEYFCDTCEKPRVPDRWVYCCPDPKCYIVSHTECVVPNPFAVAEIKAEDNALL